MAEHIEREAVRKESVCRSCFHSYVCEQFNDHRNSDNQKCHFSNDHFVPAADVAPVVHGRWEEKCVAGFDKTFCTVFVCSACETSYRVPNMNYCPNCGAHMKDGE